MKNWIKYIICASLFTTVSCGDNFLEIKPLSIFTPESIYTDKAGFDGILVNLRKNLRPDFYGEGGGLASELIASDIAISANKAANAIHNFDTQVLPTGTGTTYDFHEIWTRGYNRYEMRMLFCRVSTMANSTQKKSKMQLLPKHIFTEPIGIID